MIILGLDVGSRTVDAVWWDTEGPEPGGRVVHSAVVASGFDPQEVCSRLAALHRYDRLVTTGYGRHAAAVNLDGVAVTEISAFARGAAFLFPGARSVLDIGGQDTKVILLTSEGRLGDFEMNDKCAAGTGRFLEVMAHTLGYDLTEMAAEAAAAPEGVKVSAMCTVFAESEVTTLLHRGAERARIARGVHEAVVLRVLAMLKRLGAQPPLVFAGGGARNQALVALVRAGFRGEVLVPEEPQLVGALGAALLGAESEAGDGGAEEKR